MQIKTYDSFFPTKFRPMTAVSGMNSSGNKLNMTNTRSFNLIKKRSNTQDSNGNGEDGKEGESTKSTNIFKNDGTFSEFDYRTEKPVGGIDLFMREHSKKQRNATSAVNKKTDHNSNLAEIKRREAYESEGKSSTFQLCFIEPLPEKFKEKKQKIKEVEVYKSHQPYQPVIKLKTNGNATRTSSSTTKIRRDDPHHKKWVDQQTIQYQQKVSLLSEIFYKKPLVERAGDRFFEQFMRNRFEDEPAPPTFVHQIRTNDEESSVHNKFLSRLKKNNPNLRNYERLVLKGKHVPTKLVDNGYEDFE